MRPSGKYIGGMAVSSVGAPLAAWDSLTDPNLTRVTFKLPGSLEYKRTGIPKVTFDAAIELSYTLADSDFVSFDANYTPSPLKIPFVRPSDGFATGTSEIHYARLRIGSDFQDDRRALKIPLYIESWQASGHWGAFENTCSEKTIKDLTDKGDPAILEELIHDVKIQVRGKSTSVDVGVLENEEQADRPPSQPADVLSALPTHHAFDLVADPN